MGVNASTVDFINLASVWLTQNYDMKVLSAMVQFRGNWLNRRDIYGDFIILCAQLDSINTEIGGNHKTKYKLPIEKFGSDLIQNKLNLFFKNRFKTDVGTSISNIRGGIAHPLGQNKEFLSQIHDAEIRDLSTILFSIVLSKILIDCDVERQVTHDYQYQLGIQLLSST